MQDIENQEEVSSEYLARIVNKSIGNIYDMCMYEKYFRIEHLEEFLDIYWKHYEDYLKELTEGEPVLIECYSDIYDAAYFNEYTFRYSIDMYLIISMKSSVKRERIYDIFYLLFINILKSYRNSKFIHYLAQNDKDSYDKIDELINIYTEI